MTLARHDNIAINRQGGFSRRSFIKRVSATAAVAGTLSFRDLMSVQAAEIRKQGKSMILLWMAGGPSHLDTFDPKPGHKNSGETKAIKTSVPGIEIAHNWTKTAQVMDEIAIIRSMTNKEGNHRRATYQMHTGYVPSGSVKHPSLASCIAKEISDPAFDLPSVVSIGNTVGAGFLGVDYEPFNVQSPGRLPQDVANPVPTERFNRRDGLLKSLEKDFASRGGRVVVDNHKRLYKKASKLVLSPQVKAFSFDDEPESLQKAYGDSTFGKGCLLARRLVEAGSTFVEVQSNGWDHHTDIFGRMKTNAGQVDPAMAALISDLKQRGMLENTLVVWMGEFGRTPQLSARGGRNHYPRAFNALMAGGGVKGGQVIGSTTKDGTSVKNNPVTTPDLFTSICKSLKVDPTKENMSPLGRPMKIVDGGKVIKNLFG